MAALALLLLVVGGAVALWATHDDSGSSTAGPKKTATTSDQNGVAAIVPAFGHFGDNLAEALSVCVNAALPGDKAAFNCTFKAPNEAYSLQLSDQDPKTQDAGGVLPAFIQTPDRNTIVRQQRMSTTGDSRYHAYWMTKDSAVAAPSGPLDPAVRFILYDVDPKHPGLATFVSKDSKTAPLTQTKANELLQAIGADADKFPTPQAFTSPADSELSRFAQPVQDLPEATRPDCVAGFSMFRAELEHTTCQDGPFTLQYGLMANSDQMRAAHFAFDFATGSRRTWVDRTGATGTSVYSVRGQQRIYWENRGVPGVYGSITASREDVTRAELTAEFAKVQGVVGLS